MDVKPYKFSTLKDRVLIGGGMFTAISALSVGILTMFGPLSLGIFGAVVTGRILFTAYLIKKHLASETTSSIPAEKEALFLGILIKEISDSVGMKTPKLLINKSEHSSAEEAAKDYGASPFKHAIVVTPETLRQTLPSDQLKFIVAHEVAHLHADSKATFLVQAGLDYVSRAFMGAGAVLTIIGTIASLFIPSPPVFMAGLMEPLSALGVLVGTWCTKQLALKFTSRVIERRADRNALYITHDLKGAEGAMDHLHDGLEKTAPRFFNAILTHPVYESRVESLKKSFNEVSKYPLPEAPANDNAAKPPQQKRKLSP